MPDIVIAEPMHEAAVLELGRSFEVRYDHALGRNGAALSGAIADARALIVRDCTIIDADLLAAGSAPARDRLPGRAVRSGGRGRLPRPWHRDPQLRLQATSKARWTG